MYVTYVRNLLITKFSYCFLLCSRKPSIVPKMLTVACNFAEVDEWVQLPLGALDCKTYLLITV